ncbi:MAG: ATP-binding cassette domain-containing protein [Moraxella sp.]|nr:ATP-binding cassette domain-containing protein [Moraxella sp.]
MNQSNPLLSFHQLSVITNDKTLLQNATGKLNAGDKITLIGRSGSGKSVLLSTLANLMPHQQGNIYYRGQNINDIPPATYHAKVGLIGQTPAILDGTVLDNLSLPFSFAYHNTQKADTNWYIDKLAQFGKSADFLAQSAQDLSGGERQIVNFLRVLQLNPSILLLDEPTAALDPQTAQALVALVLQWQSSQAPAENPTQNPAETPTQNQDTPAFIWITHTPEQTHELGAKQWHMDNGVLSSDTHHTQTHHTQIAESSV